MAESRWKGQFKTATAGPEWTEHPELADDCERGMLNRKQAEVVRLALAGENLIDLAKAVNLGNGNAAGSYVDHAFEMLGKINPAWLESARKTPALTFFGVFTAAEAGPEWQGQAALARECEGAGLTKVQAACMLHQVRAPAMGQVRASRRDPAQRIEYDARRSATQRGKEKLARYRRSQAGLVLGCFPNRGLGAEAGQVRRPDELRTSPLVNVDDLTRRRPVGSEGPHGS